MTATAAAPKPLLYLDCTRSSVLVKCRECEFWHAMRFTKLEGWRAAAAHEERSHPGSKHARDALRHALAEA